MAYITAKAKKSCQLPVASCSCYQLRQLCQFHETRTGRPTTPAWVLSRGIEMAKTENRKPKPLENRKPKLRRFQFADFRFSNNKIPTRISSAQIIIPPPHSRHCDSRSRLPAQLPGDSGGACVVLIITAERRAL